MSAMSAAADMSQLGTPEAREYVRLYTTEGQRRGKFTNVKERFPDLKAHTGLLMDVCEALPCC